MSHWLLALGLPGWLRARSGRVYINVKHAGIAGALAPAPAVRSGRLADELAEGAAERAEAVASDFEADLGDR